jgi:hypothetical protein
MSAAMAEDAPEGHPITSPATGSALFIDPPAFGRAECSIEDRGWGLRRHPGWHVFAVRGFAEPGLPPESPHNESVEELLRTAVDGNLRSRNPSDHRC